MDVAINNQVASTTVPSFSEIGLDESVLKRCIVNAGLVIFAAPKSTFNEDAMTSTIKYLLENETFIKGTFIYIGEPEFHFHEISSSHSILMSRSAESTDGGFSQSNNSLMRRAADLMIFQNSGGSIKDVDDMLELALTGGCVFGQVAANGVTDVVDGIRKNYPDEKQYSKMWDFIEATGMILCQRIVENNTGNRVSVWEYLKLDKEVKALLFKVLDSAEGTEGVVKAISDIVSNNEFDSQGFQVQADDLLKAGDINEIAYRALIKADM
ncbi:hypothetical protein ACTXIV_02925 [Psychrobacter celer]|uniref:hypothetical protein n=1 Tax=Psychrobacter celer TaxID=306572 RepID=UPI003FD5A59D